jgi:hypothetical protein
VQNPARALWIWNHGGADTKAEPGTVYFRKVVELAAKPTHATAVVTCDNNFKLFLNGKEVASGSDHNKPKMVDLLPHVQAGTNVFAIAAVNRPAKPDNKEEADQSNPAGLFAYFRLRHETETDGGPVSQVWDFGSTEAWLCATNKIEGWEKPDFAATEDWAPATELGIVGIDPWKLENKIAQALSAASLAGHVRAALVAADPLMTALGRPNREQVITVRASAATTLQALEMTNGKTLSEMLKRGSEKLLERQPSSTSEFVTRLFARALARPPKPDELQMAVELVGNPAQKEGVEDLLWAVTMLPEFQLIY